MKTKQLFKLLPIAAALATLAVPAQAANWGAWSNNTNLRSPHFRQALQNMAAQANTQMVNAAFNAPQAATAPAANATTNTLPSTNVQLSDATTLLSVTRGQMLDPATGLPTGAIGGTGVDGAAALAALGGTGGGSTAATITLPGAATITLPSDMVYTYQSNLSSSSGVSPSEMTNSHITMICPDPSTCVVLNRAANYMHTTRAGQAWGTWAGAVNATYAIYTRQAGSAQLNFSQNMPSAIYQYAVGPEFTGTLPTTGTFNYTYLGGVISDQLTGVAGTISSASLTANFTAGTVQNTLNATVAGTNYVVTTPATAITVNVALNTGATCTPACVATTNTVFNNAAGAGAIVTTTINNTDVTAQTVFLR